MFFNPAKSYLKAGINVSEKLLGSGNILTRTNVIAVKYS
jgi:hypothetical protein